MERSRLGLTSSAFSRAAKSEGSRDKVSHGLKVIKAAYMSLDLKAKGHQVISGVANYLS